MKYYNNKDSNTVEYLLKTKRTKSELEKIFVQLNIKASKVKYNCLCKFSMMDLINNNINISQETGWKLRNFTNFQLYILLRLTVKNWVISYSYSDDLRETDYEDIYN